MPPLNLDTTPDPTVYYTTPMLTLSIQLDTNQPRPQSSPTLIIFITRDSFKTSISPVWGMRKVNQFPLVEKDFSTNFQKITTLGIEI